MLLYKYINHFHYYFLLMNYLWDVWYWVHQCHSYSSGHNGLWSCPSVPSLLFASATCYIASSTWSCVCNWMCTGPLRPQIIPLNASTIFYLEAPHLFITQKLKFWMHKNNIIFSVSWLKTGLTQFFKTNLKRGWNKRDWKQLPSDEMKGLFYI